MTQPSHNRDFLLKFAKDRDAYRAMWRSHLAARSYVRLLTYCITYSHAHLLLTNGTTDVAVSNLMQAMEGEFAGYYNRRTGRSGAFWGGRFHATMIEGGGKRKCAHSFLMPLGERRSTAANAMSSSSN